MISIDNQKCTLTYLLTTSVTDRQTNGRQTVLYISDIKFLKQYSLTNVYCNAVLFVIILHYVFGD